MIFRPHAVEDVEPFVGARVAVIVLLKSDAVFLGFVGPPGGDDVEREAAVADVIDVGGLLGEQTRADETSGEPRPSARGAR